MPSNAAKTEVRMVYLDISKAFDRVSHKGLLFKLKSIGIRDPLPGWLTSYLSHRKQRVVIDGQSSNWSNVSDGVPKVSQHTHLQVLLRQPLMEGPYL